MGNYTAVSHPDYECIVWATWDNCGTVKTFPYPSGNSQLTQRITADEWHKFDQDMNSVSPRLYYIIPVAIIMVIALILSIHASAYLMILFVFGWLSVFGYFIFLMSQANRLLRQYNTVLFTQRGIRAFYSPGGKRRPPCLTLKFAYPATPLAAKSLPTHYTGCCSMDSEQPLDNEHLANLFREKNQFFATSPLASCSGPYELGMPAPQLGGATVAPLAQVALATPTSVATEQIQVIVPENLGPERQVNVLHNGMQLTIQVPPNAVPGQAILINAPAPAPMAEAVGVPSIGPAANRQGPYATVPKY